MENNKKVLIFAGTVEGRMLTELLGGSGVKVHACVVTDYGRKLIGESETVEVSSHRLGMEGMCRLMREYPTVVDATHPYASTVSDHIRKACAETGAEYIRLLRPKGDTDTGGDIIRVPDIDSAAEYLKGTEGNVLISTGSKELCKFTVIDNYRERLFARVLSLPSVASACSELGFEGRNLFCMQGPYSEDMNYAMLKQVDARYLVTKDSGEPGGFEEKMRAAERAGCKVVLVGRPEEDAGRSFDDVYSDLCARFSVPKKDTGHAGRRRITLAGIGMGPSVGVTEQVLKAISDADVVFGADRITASVDLAGKEVINEYRAQDVLGRLDGDRRYRDAVVLFSGDVGFYSGAKSMLDAADRSVYDVDVMCGVSSVSYLCSKLGIPWQDVRLVSSHGKEANIIGEVRRNHRVFTLLDSEEAVKRMCSDLVLYGMGETKVTVACDMGYSGERIFSGSPSAVSEEGFSKLCVALIENPGYDPRSRIGIPDAEFVRGDAPMTKSEIRAISVSRMELTDDSVVYDVGAGTGSVSVEMASTAVNGKVYAIEKDADSAALIEKNKIRFAVPNVEVVIGTAPDALADLPVPTHAFIGGSSGNLREILVAILERNPDTRVIVNSVTLETLAETVACARELHLRQEDIICVNVSRARAIGGYNLMAAQNPVYIAVFGGMF